VVHFRVAKDVKDQKKAQGDVEEVGEGHGGPWRQDSAHGPQYGANGEAGNEAAQEEFAQETKPCPKALPCRQSGPDHGQAVGQARSRRGEAQYETFRGMEDHVRVRAG